VNLGEAKFTKGRIGERGIRTPVGASQQIYSLPPLATRAPHHMWHLSIKPIITANSIACDAGAQDGTRIRDLFLTKEVLYRLSYLGTSNSKWSHYGQCLRESKEPGGTRSIRRIYHRGILPCFHTRTVDEHLGDRYSGATMQPLTPEEQNRRANYLKRATESLGQAGELLNNWHPAHGGMPAGFRVSENGRKDISKLFVDAMATFLAHASSLPFLSITPPEKIIAVAKAASHMFTCSLVFSETDPRLATAYSAVDKVSHALKSLPPQQYQKLLQQGLPTFTADAASGLVSIQKKMLCQLMQERAAIMREVSPHHHIPAELRNKWQENFRERMETAKRLIEAFSVSAQRLEASGFFAQWKWLMQERCETIDTLRGTPADRCDARFRLLMGAAKVRGLFSQEEVDTLVQEIAGILATTSEEGMRHSITVQIRDNLFAWARIYDSKPQILPPPPEGLRTLGKQALIDQLERSKAGHLSSSCQTLLGLIDILSTPLLLPGLFSSNDLVPYTRQAFECFNEISNPNDKQTLETVISLLKDLWEQRYITNRTSTIQAPPVPLWLKFFCEKIMETPSSGAPYENLGPKHISDVLDEWKKKWDEGQ
jgi:hypothetical protein